MVASLLVGTWMILGPALLAPAAGSSPEGELGAPSLTTQYGPIVERIVNTALAGNEAYRKLEELCDGIGHRLSGSRQLEQAIDWAIGTMTKDGQENVRGEKVMVPVWVRGRESATMIAPRREPLVMLGLGGSVGTPPEGITAPMAVVSNEAELEQLGEAARGKIVLFNNAMPPYSPEAGSGYGTTVRFRHKGARLAAEKGAVACLIRSVTAHSLRTPHTGATSYGETTNRIPAAALTVEDAEMIARLVRRGERVEVNLMMEATTLPDAESANVVGELRGREKPEEIVVVGGHIDSWDVGQGAQDDGGGCVVAMEAINVLRKLKLTPRRTIRVVLWTNEENGLRGAKAYAATHAAALPDHVAAIESDGGIFRPLGFSLECADADRQAVAAEQLREILALLVPLGALRVDIGGSGADVSTLKSAGVVLLGHEVEGSKYFDYHHTPADTLDKIDPHELSQNVALLAAVTFILADMPDRLGTQTPPAKANLMTR
ncbi:MAG: M20/M25/M40 family metallo-hydrolase [Planctomycetes bacterium]|nr:M20/M25/M40 family metallo-hydrolase [Planctomycetota bacterium]